MGYSPEYYKKNREKIRRQQKASYKRNKKKRLAQCKVYYKDNKPKIQKRQKKYYEDNKDKLNSPEAKEKRNRLRRERLQAMRLELIEFLGGRCQNSDCPIPDGCSDVRALEFHHINPAESERRTKKSREKVIYQLYRWYKQGILKEKIKLLCAVCHRIETDKQRQ